MEEMAVSSTNFMLGFKCPPHPDGEENLRLELLGDLAGDLLIGESSPLYAKLYHQGLIDKGFFVSYDNSPKAAFLAMGGESKDPDAVCARVTETVARIASDGFDGPAFERARRAVYGSWLRGLDRFDDVCIDMAEGLFGGYEHMDAFPLLGAITAAECAAWLTETLAPERLALSVVAPKGGDGDADDDA